MRIALVHYHLRRGGVSSVLLHQARGLVEAGDEVLIITGEELGADPGIPQVTVEALGYDLNREPPAAGNGPAGNAAAGTDAAGTDAAGKALADALTAAMEAHWGCVADVLHVHNPLIQKNAALLPALKVLTQRGIPLLLQNHDLAEDFRPNVYISGEDYPENCHYAVINSRDYSFLLRAGLKHEGLHLLPNEVAPIEELECPERKRYLYPVRAIRRKNIGEALLISLFLPPGMTLAITLPPTTEKDGVVYRFWVNFARELGLPVEFEAGLSAGIGELFGGAWGIITTSVKEGFGFSFLEPWTAGRGVIGRRIDYVCRDFEREGIRFNSSTLKNVSQYSSLHIPMDYVAVPVFKKKLEQTVRGIYQAFALTTPDYIIKLLDTRFFSGSMIDFGCLDEELQAGLIRVLAANEAVFREIAAVNPFLGGLADWRPDEELVEANRQCISRAYGKERITAILRDTYRTVRDTRVSQRISKSLLLELCLDPQRLFLVGVGYG
ncbi:MAG: glycosyltransferase family 1 protein [Spirochaetaceae bacterium]|nr:glycosyltransferase family 1 protein [Spirochaetaceae bacterium]